MDAMAQFHSISTSGMQLFDRPINSTIGGLRIDLASAPIAAGTHKLELEAAIGGIEIYLPEYVKFTIEGESAIGGQDIHVGRPIVERMGRWLAALFGMSNQIPKHAVPNPHPEQAITIHFVIEGGIGGLDIYRI